MQDFISSVAANIAALVQAKYQNFILFAPYVLGAIGIFILGYILAELVAYTIIRMSKNLRLEFISEKIGLKKLLAQAKFNDTPSVIIAKTVKAYLIFLFFIEATKIAGLKEVSEFLGTVISFVPDLIIALFIVLVGVNIGNTVQLVIKTSLNFARESTGNALAVAAKYTVVVFSGLAALSQLQIAEILIQTLFIGFVAMLTIAGGLAFGLGGKDLVKEVLEAFKNMELIEFMEEQRKKRSTKPEKGEA